MHTLQGKSFLKILDLSNAELEYLLKLAHDLKKAKHEGKVNKPLKGKAIALLFQKDSTRTRCAFEVAAADLGMHTVYIGPSGSQFAKKESIEDTAKVLGRMFDGIQFRGYEHCDVETLAAHTGVPVWNGLTNDWHPTQMIADFMTMQESFGNNLKQKKIVYIGDGRNNVASSLMVTALKLGMHFVMLAPHELMPSKELISKCEQLARENDGKLELSSNWKAATQDAHVLYTDVWVSMGESDWSQRLELLHNYQVNTKMLENARDDAIFLHCLPAFHDLNTVVSRAKAKEYGAKYPNVQGGAFEVTDAVFRSQQARVFDQAENRLHSIKAILLATMS